MFLCYFAIELRRPGTKWFPSSAYVFKCYICYICKITVLLFPVQVLILQAFLPFLQLHVLCSWLHWRIQQVLSPSFSIMPSHVLPYFYALISFPNIFVLLKLDGFVPLSCLHAHDVLSVVERLGSSRWSRWTALQEFFLGCWGQLLMLLSWTGFCLVQSTSTPNHPDFLWDELLWQAGSLLKKNWRRRKEVKTSKL